MIRKRLTQKTIVLAIALVLGVASTSLAAEGPEMLTLQQIIDAAVKNNPATVESQKRWEEKTSRISIVTAQPNPKLGIMKDDIPTGSINPGKGMMTEFSISQEIMNPAKVKAMGKMAENEANMMKADWDAKQVELYVQAKQAYYDYIYARQALEIGKESQQLMGQLVQLAQVNYSTGMVPLQDTLKMQTEFSQMKVDLLSMASMEGVAKAKINNIMGRSTNTGVETKEEFAAPPPDFDLDKLVKEASDGKPSIVGMQYQAAMAQSGIELAKKQQLPDFEISLGYKKNKEPMLEAQADPMDPMNTTFMLGDRKPTWKMEVMVMLPIWQGKNKAEIKAAQANYAASQAALQNMRNMSELDIQMALTEAQSTWRQIGLYQNTVIPQAEQTYQAAIVGYTNGKVDMMTVLADLNTLHNAKLGLYKVKTDYEKAAANLEKAVGKPLFKTTTQS